MILKNVQHSRIDNEAGTVTDMKDMDYALMLIKANNFEGAREIFEKMLESDPKNRDILYNLGMCHSELGNPDKAIEILSECVRVYPNYSNAYVALGYAHSLMEKFDLAIDSFQKAIEIDPVNSYAFRNLGALYAQQGDNGKAIEYLERSFAINPEDQQTAYGLGYAYFVNRELEQADHYLTIAISIDGATKIAEFSKDLKSRIAEISLKKEGFRTDAMFYCLSALQFFKNKTKKDINLITLEIALKGTEGLDVNDPAERYSIKSLKGTFSGLHLFCYMYVGFQVIDPTANLGMDISQEYKEALRLFEQGSANGHTIH